MLGSAAPQKCLGNMGTLPRRVPLGARTRWQVRESRDPASAAREHSRTAFGVPYLYAPTELSPSHVVWLWSPRSPCWGAVSPSVAGDARASSQPWIPRLVFSSVSFFPQCVIAVHSPPQLSPMLAERGGPSGGWLESGRCWREPSPGLLLTAPGPASPNGDGALPLFAAREGLSPSQHSPGRKGGTWGAADGKFRSPEHPDMAWAPGDGNCSSSSCLPLKQRMCGSMAAPWVVALPAGHRPVGHMGRDMKHWAGLVHHELLLGCVGAETCAWMPDLGTGGMHRVPRCAIHGRQVLLGTARTCACVSFSTGSHWGLAAHSSWHLKHAFPTTCPQN